MFGDVLPVLGTSKRNSFDPLLNVKPGPQIFRNTMRKLLSETPLQILLLKDSKYHHYGTMPEFIDFFCHNEAVGGSLGFTRNHSNKFGWDAKLITGDGLLNGNGKDLKLFSENRPNAVKYDESVKACVLNSIFSSPPLISESAVIEFCYFSCSVSIGTDTVLSCCSLTSDDIDSTVVIPPGYSYNSIAVDDPPKWCCIAVDVNADVKKIYETSNIGEMMHFGVPIHDFISKVGLNSEDVLNGGKGSLWDSKLFPLATTMEEAFILTLELMEIVKANDSTAFHGRKYEWISCQDLAKRKNVPCMLEYQQKLHRIIKRTVPKWSRS